MKVAQTLMAETKAEQTPMDCSLAVRSAESNMTAVRLGLKRMLDSLTAGVTTPQKEPLLGERLAIKMDKMMALNSVGMLVEVKARTMDYSLVESLGWMLVEVKMMGCSLAVSLV